MSPVEIPEIEENRTFNILTSIWIVPLIALIISAALLYKHYSQLGSEIKIDFPSSDGLVPQESVIKFRDVAIGKITRIELQQNGDGVTIVARMNKEAEPYLNSSTRFWIVKPQVDYSGIRGLDTLLHGAYIAMYAPEKGELKTHFKGLQKPFRSENEGRIFHLHTKKLGNIHIGAPVYYRDLAAGSIEDISLSSDKINAEITVFIKNQYAKLINSSTKFWHQDLVDINMENGRLGLDMAPLTSVLLGSINFESKFDKDYPSVASNHIFRLYDRYADTVREVVGGSDSEPVYLRLVFEGRVKGLYEGIKIRYQGFDAGEIERVSIRYNPQSSSMRAETFGTLDASVFRSREHNGTYNLKKAVEKGLRAELSRSNPLFGELFVSLDYPSDESNVSKKWTEANGFVEFPTKKEVNRETLSKLENLLDSFSELASESRKPLKELLAKLNKSADSLNELMNKKSFKNLTDDLNGGELDKAIVELRKTLRETKALMRGYSRNSLFGKKLETMLKEVGKTSEETKRLIQKLNKKPNALIFGD